MKEKRCTVNDLLNLIPEELFEKLAKDHKVDYQVKKLYGKRIFQLLVYGLLSQKELSFRILEELFSKALFRQYAGIPWGVRTDHSSLSERLSYINAEYFKELFEKVSAIMQLYFPAQSSLPFKLIRFDSTLISISSKLLKTNGMKVGQKPKDKEAPLRLQIKFSIGFDGQNIRKALFFNEQRALTEDFALREAIRQSQIAKDEIVVFDRGISKRKTFDEFSQDQIQFVTRLRASQQRLLKYKQVGLHTEIAEGQFLETPTLKIHRDLEVHLFGSKHKKTQNTFRLIQATIKKSNEPINFLTNISALDAQSITEIYRRRWDIEVLFKFLKQELGLKHFLSRNENGIKVVMYTTLITAMLIYLYKSNNLLDSYKIAKLRFANELELEMLKIVVEICRENPEMIKTLDSS